MRVIVKGKSYNTLYFPFFKIAAQCSRNEGFDVYGLRYPSGEIEEVVVFDPSRRRAELQEHLAFLIREYVMEDDDVLSPRAKELKKDVKDLFGID